MLTDAEIAARYVKIRPYLDERQRRLWLGVEAQGLRSGGVAGIARATGPGGKTVRRGTAEIESRAERGGGGARPRGRGPWRAGAGAAGEREGVSVHDFADEEVGKVTPYGSCDLTANTGWVNVGTDHDTGAFAVASIRSWWNGPGRAAYPGARRLLVTADSGGSNGSPRRPWKTGLAPFAAEAGPAIHVPAPPP